MSDKKYDVFGVGNAIVDILAQVDDHVIGDLGLAKGGMALMDTDRQGDILTEIRDPSLSFAAGGSAANTMVAITQSGGTAAYSGKVAADTNGEFYKKGMQEEGIHFYIPEATEPCEPTGSCVVLTTPDAERTMCTHLGVSTSLQKSDLDFDLLAQSKCSYIEGYLWDAEGPRAACLEAFEQSKKLGVQAAFTFSDAFLIDRFSDDFQRIAKEYCDIIFCNSDEAKQFFNTDNLDQCVKEMGQLCKLAFVTDGGNGSYVIVDGVSEHVPGFDVKAVDSVGAGDGFAGGVLYGITNGLSPAKSAKWGNYFAAQVVAKFGPRLEGCMKDKLATVIG